MYPIQLNLNDKRVVVIGGGKIAYRKVKQILKEDLGTLHIISKKFLPEFFEIEHPNVKLRTKCYDHTDIEGADIIIAATNDASVNTQIKRDAKSYQWVNQTDNKTQSDFYNMREIEFDDIKLTFSSEGIDCRKVKHIAQAVETFLNETYKEDKS
ncbi:precorrin-2 dehydrogenase/sirohydrochlorin ferrochelatase family protein [Staphylococcus caeli]|uniref:precorrin-2 dehydrogenase n=1 Tax=Staphylococcus caeli TaxID=2201815 RepID=A0A1D4L789_9STAP|nr:bifunctional precorrin-2 dehydrogenase/sirohydrochlorin ferrochelatase [Staphylococcus caeli]SCS81862.1 SirA [Staphylococcus caeli]SCS92411.1 SirA [Staphylococcus caeli]